MRYPEHCIKFLLFLTLIDLTANSNLHARPKERLRVDMRHRPPEMIVEDGKFSGPLVDIATELAKKVDQKILMHTVAFPNSLKRVRALKTDLLPRTFCSAERLKTIDYIGPIGYQEKEIKFLIRKENLAKLKKYEDLYQLKVGVKEKTIYFDKFDKDAKLKKVASKDDFNMVKMLDSERFDAMTVIDLQAADEAIKKNKLTDLVYADYSHKKKIWNYFAIGKNSPKIQELQSALLEMVKSGFTTKAYEKHGVTPPIVDPNNLPSCEQSLQQVAH